MTRDQCPPVRRRADLGCPEKGWSPSDRLLLTTAAAATAAAAAATATAAAALVSVTCRARLKDAQDRSPRRRRRHRRIRRAAVLGALSPAPAPGPRRLEPPRACCVAPCASCERPAICHALHRTATPGLSLRAISRTERCCKRRGRRATERDGNVFMVRIIRW